jgi:lipooligosaccharide transport system permease protein
VSAVATLGRAASGEPGVFRSALHVLEFNLIGYRRTYQASVFSSFVQPILFLAAMGLGLGGIVDNSPASGSLAGGSYLGFIAPGLLAATAMQTASGEAMYPIIAGFKWVRTFHAMAATPVTAAGIVLGQVGFLVFRIGLVGGIFAIVITLFGVGGDPFRLLLAFGATLLTGLAFAAPLTAWSASRDSPASFSTIVRFVVTPLFLFSGTFFPVDRLPPLLQSFAALTPLYHGVALARGTVLGTIDVPTAAGHIAYLSAMTVVGIVACLVIFPRRLVK